MPRIVALTIGNEYGDRILLSLALLGVVPDAILYGRIEPAPQPFREHLLDLVRSRSPRRAVAAVLRRALRMAEGPPPPQDAFRRWRGMARDFREMRGFNDEPMLNALRELRPDYVILAATDIIKPSTLEIPSIGTINAHPGLLPFARGLGVVARSLERGVPVGLTVHYVNPGIDTGDIIHREMVPVTETDTLESLERKADERAARALAEVIAAAARGERPPRARQRHRYAYCKWMSPEERARMNARIRDGRALSLYREWRAFFGSDVIPADAEEYPELEIEPLPAKPTDGATVRGV